MEDRLLDDDINDGLQSSSIQPCPKGSSSSGFHKERNLEKSKNNLKTPRPDILGRGHSEKLAEVGLVDCQKSAELTLTL